MRGDQRVDVARNAFTHPLDRVVVYLFIFGFGYIYVHMIPWVEIFGEDWKDISRYLFRIAYLARGGEEREYSGISVLFSEILWKEILLWINQFFESHREGLFFCSYLALVFYSLFTFRRVNILLALVFFFNPMFIDLILGQIRMALAFSLLLWAYGMRERRVIFFMLLSVSVMIHTGTLLFMGIYLVLKKMDERYGKEIFYKLSLIFGILFAFFIKYGLILILFIVGDRRADSYASGSIASSSMAFSLTWFMVALLLAFEADYEHEEQRMIVGFSIVMMSLMFSLSTLHLYGQRYVAISVPLIIISIGYLPKPLKQWTLIYLFIYQFLQWKYRLVLTII